jgi:uncharacterized protein (UPF0335 family)
MCLAQSTEHISCTVYDHCMAKNAPEKAIAELMPDEISAVKALVKEFMGKVQSVDDEIATLKEDRKEIIEEFSDRLDMKTLQLALKVLKLQSAVAHRDAYDLFIEALTDPAA